MILFIYLFFENLKTTNNVAVFWTCSNIINVKKKKKDSIKNLDSNQIKFFINLEIIGEEDKKQKIIFIFFTCSDLAFLFFID